MCNSQITCCEVFAEIKILQPIKKKNLEPFSFLHCDGVN